MDLITHYNNLYNESIKKIKTDTYQIDSLIEDVNDNRFGITLLIRPNIQVKNEIQKFLEKLKLVDPNQYYYNNSDIHITVMSIISCYDGFKLENINLVEYNQVIKASLIENPEIEISFKGLTASSSCIMIQGFLNNESLNIIRDNLRTHFKNTNLEQSIDKRYSIQTAHSTVVRFKETFLNKKEFLKLIATYKDYNFGSFKPTHLELVYNDWYQKEAFVKKLSNFSI
jgi:2'-5' RNA ligase